MSDDAGENPMPGRSKSAFMLVNTLKITVVFGVLPTLALLVIGRRINLDFLGHALSLLIVSSIAGCAQAMVAWQKIEKCQLVRTEQAVIGRVVSGDK